MSKLDRFNPTDLTALMQAEIDGDRGLLKDKIYSFAARFEPLLLDLEKAHFTLNFRELKRFALALGSGARELGLRTTADLCERIEDMAHLSQVSQDDLQKLKAEIYPALDELIAFDAMISRDDLGRIARSRTR